MEDDATSMYGQKTQDDLAAFSPRHFVPLVELLVAKDQELATILGELSDPEDADRLAKDLFVLFEGQRCSDLLLDAAITREITQCPRSNLLFRTNSLCTKIMTVFARTLGIEYLVQTIGASVKRIASATQSFEVDPTRAQADTDLAGNMDVLASEVETFLQDIFSSLKQWPAQFRQVCHTLQSVAVKKFEDARHTTVAGFYFLRYVCPAIVAPPTYGLLEAFPKKNSHRGLVLIAKILQNIANGARFGDKEPHMVPLNDIIEKYEPRVKEFLDALTVTEEGAAVLSPTAYTEQEKLLSIFGIYQHLARNAMRIEEGVLNIQGVPNAQSVWMSAKIVLSELERVSQAHKHNTHTTKRGERLVGESTSSRISVLNRGMEWRDAARHPNVAALELIKRARKLVEDATGAGNVVDWLALQETVDYKEFALDTGELNKVDSSLLGTQKESLTFWLNVYNILSIHTHVEYGSPTAFKGRRRNMFFHAFGYDICGQQFTLEDLVEGVIRANPREHFKKKDPRLNFCMKQYDPRAHFGYSCLASFSPPIRVFWPDTLSFQLTAAAEMYFREQVVIDLERRRIRLPLLFKYYYSDFGNYEADVFRWMALYTDQQTQQEASNLIATMHYSIDYIEPVWEPRRVDLFYDDVLTAERNKIVDDRNALLNIDTNTQRCRENSTAVPVTNLKDNLGVANVEITWTTPVKDPIGLTMRLLNQADALCKSFLFEWGRIAGSPEFKAFELCTNELQAVSLDSLTKETATPFWYNVHNLLIIHLYIIKRPPSDKLGLGRKHFFATYKYAVGGYAFSLDDIEHGILYRNEYRSVIKKSDPRHKYIVPSIEIRTVFALSHLTKGTALIRLYQASGLDALLTRSMQSFLRTNAYVNDEKERVTMPFICKDVYENAFKKKKADFLKWSVNALSSDQRRLFEELLQRKANITLTFSEPDWTPWPVFGTS